MGANTLIEWAANPDGSPGNTWNPIRARDRQTGLEGTFCVHASDGCRNCYAETFQARKLPRNGIGLPYAAQYLDRVDFFLAENVLTKPLQTRKPSTFFLSSLTDPFGEWVTDEWLDRMFAVMALCPQHVFVVLTKRAERMRRYLTVTDPRRLETDVGKRVWKAAYRIETGKEILHSGAPWPLPNVILMVSAEDQKTADARIPLLLRTPAAWRGVSCEPLLAPVDLTAIDINGEGTLNALTPYTFEEAIADWRDTSPTWEEDFEDWFGELPTGTGPMHKTLDWVIAGFESGPKARIPIVEAARSLRDQCAASGTPFDFKQWGEWAPVELTHPGDRRAFDEATGMARVGKAKAGRHLDGVLHSARPAIFTQASGGERS